MDMEKKSKIPKCGALNDFRSDRIGVIRYQRKNNRQDHRKANHDDEYESGNIFSKNALKHTSPVRKM